MFVVCFLFVALYNVHTSRCLLLKAGTNIWQNWYINKFNSWIIKKRQRVTLSYTLSCYLIFRLFPGLLHFLENKRYCISNRKVFNGTNMVSKIHQKHLECYQFIVFRLKFCEIHICFLFLWKRFHHLPRCHTRVHVFHINLTLELFHRLSCFRF